MHKLLIIVPVLLIIIGLAVLPTPAWPFGIFLIVVGLIVGGIAVRFALQVLNATHG